MPDLRKFNINYYFWVKLTDRGREIVLREHAELRKLAPELDEIPAVLKNEQEDGFSKWQAWDLMRTFGPYIGMAQDPPFETSILIDFEDGL